jgi:uncharacterized repeat protein (TIGR02543 family)
MTSSGSTLLRLTPNTNGGDWATSAWFNAPQPVSGGFSTTFTFRISNTTTYNADGFAFLVQNSSTAALGYRGCGVGFGYDPSGYGCSINSTADGISNSVAIQFKTYDNAYPAEYPNTANSVSIMNNGMAANCIAYSCAIATNNSLQVAGAVTTSGTTVTWVSGSQFNPSWTAGTAILINGVSYSIASVASTTSLTVSTAPPTNSAAVQYSIGAPVNGTVSTTGTSTVTWVSGNQFNAAWDVGTQIVINGVAYTITSGPVAESSVQTTATTLTVSPTPPSLSGVPFSVGTILTDANVHTVTISYTPTPTASSSPSCIVEGTPEPCIDVILDGVDLFNGGVLFNMSTIGLASGTNAWVGFTGGNAGGNDDEDILSWTYSTQSQSQSSTVTPTTSATYTYNGGCNPNNSGCTSGGYNNSVGENPGSSLTINNMVVTAIPVVAGNGSDVALNQAACNAIVQAVNPNTDSSPWVTATQTAQCFVYTNGGGTGIDAPVMFAVSCPGNSNEQCDTSSAPFFAALSTYFSFTCAENPPLMPVAGCEPNSASSFDNFTSPFGPTTTTFLPTVGFLQGAGPDPNNPCTPATGANALPLFQSNQIASYVLGDTSSKPMVGGSTTLTSCLVATYNTPNEIPTAAVNTINGNPPVTGATYTQGSVVTANYTCTAISTDHDSIFDPTGYPNAGPYLTVSSCTATSGLTAGAGPGSTSGSCTPSSPYNSANSSTFLDTCTNTITLDTTDVGALTLTVDVEDSAMSTGQQQVTYNVVPTYALTTAANPSAGGSVLPASGGSYASGTVVPVTEIANPGYVFTGWSGACSGTGACSVTMNAAESVTANFLPLYVLTTAANPSAGGSVLPASGGSYTSGTVVPVTETANPGYVFTGWSGACSGTGACSVTMNAAKSVTANFGSALSISPLSLNFGTVNQGTITTQVLTLINTGKSTITMTEPFISLVKGQNDAFVILSWCGKSLAPGAKCFITVSFLAGPFYSQQLATLNVMDNAPGNPQAIALSAMVVDPQASLSASSLSFGTLAPNSITTKTVTLKNTGGTTLTISNIALSGSSTFTLGSSATPCGSSLASGASCIIDVTFKPTAKASYSGTLQITDNAITGSTQRVSLTGAGN